MTLLRMLIAATIIAYGASGSTVLAHMVRCDNTDVAVNDPFGELAIKVCEAVERAVVLFERCNVPALSRPIQVDLVEDLLQGCVGVYHCGENLIELLPPDAMEERRDKDGAFIDLGSDAYFQSVVVHELAHAASDGIACPFDACVAAQEYISYTMQIMSLSPQQRKAFEVRSDLERPVSSDELSEIMLYLAPHRFAQKVWAHFSQRENPCEYIGQLVDGSILIDQERF